MKTSGSGELRFSVAIAVGALTKITNQRKHSKNEGGLLMSHVLSHHPMQNTSSGLRGKVDKGSQNNRIL